MLAFWIVVELEKLREQIVDLTLIPSEDFGLPLVVDGYTEILDRCEEPVPPGFCCARVNSLQLERLVGPLYVGQMDLLQ